jgi:hypothetical protein
MSNRDYEWFRSYYYKTVVVTEVMVLGTWKYFEMAPSRNGDKLVHSTHVYRELCDCIFFSKPAGVGENEAEAAVIKSFIFLKQHNKIFFR